MNIYRKLIDLFTEATEVPLEVDHGVIPDGEPQPELPKNNVKKYGRKFRKSAISSADPK